MKASKLKETLILDNDQFKEKIAGERIGFIFRVAISEKGLNTGGAVIDEFREFMVTHPEYVDRMRTDFNDLLKRFTTKEPDEPVN